MYVDVHFKHKYPRSLIDLLASFQEHGSCPVCYGAGEILLNTLDPEDLNVYVTDCPNCDGRGWVYVLTLN